MPANKTFRFNFYIVTLMIGKKPKNRIHFYVFFFSIFSSKVFVGIGTVVWETFLLSFFLSKKKIKKKHRHWMDYQLMYSGSLKKSIYIQCIVQYIP